MVVYYSFEKYMDTCTALEAKLAAMDTILSNMETAMAAGALTANKQEYMMDNGQTKIEVTYSDFNSLTLAYDRMLFVRDKIMQRLNNNKIGRMVRLVDGKNFNGAV